MGEGGLSEVAIAKVPARGGVASDQGGDSRGGDVWTSYHVRYSLTLFFFQPPTSHLSVKPFVSIFRIHPKSNHCSTTSTVSAL